MSMLYYDRFVYFILDAERNAVKIGKTYNLQSLKRRQVALQMGNPTQLLLVGLVECHARTYTHTYYYAKEFRGMLKGGHRILGYTDLESTLHERFSTLHIRGEWFRYEGELKQFIQSSNVAPKEV